MNVIISNEEHCLQPETVLNMLDALSTVIHRTTHEDLARLKKAHLSFAMKRGDVRGVFVKAVLMGMGFFKEYKTVLEEAVKNSRVVRTNGDSVAYSTENPRWRSDFLVNTIQEKGLLPIASFLWIVSHQLDYDSLLDDAEELPSITNDQGYIDHMNSLKELKKINEKKDFIAWLAMYIGPNTALELVKGTPLESRIELIHV